MKYQRVPMPPVNLEETVLRYNSFVESGVRARRQARKARWSACRTVGTIESAVQTKAAVISAQYSSFSARRRMAETAGEVAVRDK